MERRLDLPRHLIRTATQPNPRKEGPSHIMDLAITTLVTVPAILGLVTIARDLGVPAKLAPALAVLFGVLASRPR